MTDRELSLEWLRRAKSNLSMAQVGKTDAICYEDLCFNAQQGVEKALKALCIARHIVFPKTHNITVLLDRLAVDDPLIIQARGLNEYAVTSRYPGDYEPISVEEYEEVIAIAAHVVTWVTQQIEENYE
jgi:HEPN domain-containing protein